MRTCFKYLIISILLCLVAEPSLAQNNKNKDKDKDKKKEYPHKATLWQLDEDYAIKEYKIDNDTSLHLFQVYDYNDKKSLSVSNLGNMGSPYISNIFDDRQQNRKSPVFFMDYMSDFVSKPEDTKFYQVNHPYTWLYYATTPKSRNGQIVDLCHTQNVNKQFNWGFNIGLVGSTGRISHQHTRNINFSPQLSYIGKHLNIHFFYKFNKLSVEENGGIDDTKEIKNNRFTTKMSDAFSTWGRRTWCLIGEYSLGKTDFNIINDSTRYEIYTPKVAFTYAFSYDKIFRNYEDTKIVKGVYPDFYQSTNSTYDSLYFHRITNKFQIKLCENQYLPALKGTLGIENDSYNNFRNYLYNNSNDTYMNTFIEGAITKNKTRSLILNGRYRQYMTGYKAGDIIIKGNLGMKFFKGESDTLNCQLKASIDFNLEEPTYFEKYYYSNHYQWNNNFNKSKIIRLGGDFEIPRWHLKLGASYYMLNDYVYIGDNAKPKQLGNPVNVFSASIMKDFFVWHVRFANRITYQKSDEKDFNLPDFALYHATYFEFYLVKNVLLTQLGGEIRYSGEYNAFGYAPSTSLFYNKGRIMAGNYPIISGFANIKIRGVLMFFKWENITDGMFQDWYGGTDAYPLQDFHFMFGILWRFAD